MSLNLLSSFKKVLRSPKTWKVVLLLSSFFIPFFLGMLSSFFGLTASIILGLSGLILLLKFSIISIGPDIQFAVSAIFNQPALVYGPGIHLGFPKPIEQIVGYYPARRIELQFGEQVENSDMTQIMGLSREGNAYDKDGNVVLDSDGNPEVYRRTPVYVINPSITINFPSYPPKEQQSSRRQEQQSSPPKTKQTYLNIFTEFGLPPQPSDSEKEAQERLDELRDLIEEWLSENVRWFISEVTYIEAYQNQKRLRDTIQSEISNSILQYVIDPEETSQGSSNVLFRMGKIELDKELMNQMASTASSPYARREQKEQADAERYRIEQEGQGEANAWAKLYEVLGDNGARQMVYMLDQMANGESNTYFIPTELTNALSRFGQQIPAEPDANFANQVQEQMTSEERSAYKNKMSNQKERKKQSRREHDRDKGPSSIRRRRKRKKNS